MYFVASEKDKALRFTVKSNLEVEAVNSFQIGWLKHEHFWHLLQVSRLDCPLYTF